MIRRPPRSTRTYTLLPYTTLFRSDRRDAVRPPGGSGLRLDPPVVTGLGPGARLLGQPDGHAVLRARAIPPLAVVDHGLDTGVARVVGSVHERFRSVDRRVGIEGVHTCDSLWLPYDY